MVKFSKNLTDEQILGLIRTREKIVAALQVQLVELHSILNERLGKL